MKKLPFTVAFILPFFLSHNGHAWGYRGHHVICSIAARLVKEEGLKSFVRFRSEHLGYLCNVPDVIWKGDSKIPQGSKTTHFVNPEKYGMTVATIPPTIEELLKAQRSFLKGEEKSDQWLLEDLGTLWFRALQIFQLSLESLKELQTSKPPIDRKQEQDFELPYNKSIYHFYVNMGLMGHFIADSSMPYHTSADYDGEKVGHPGIHFYYEDALVSEMPTTWISEIERAAQKSKFKEIRHENGDLNLFESLRKLSSECNPDRKKIEKLDLVLDTEKRLRPTPEKALKKFKPLLIKHLSLAARLLALSWDDIYRQAGKPSLSAYKSYQFPFSPAHVPLEPVFSPKAK